MTQITTGEIKIILFALFFMSILGGFVIIYNQSPVKSIDLKYEKNVTRLNNTVINFNNSIDTNNFKSFDWITGIIKPLPKPFNDNMTLFISSLFLLPITIILFPIGARIIKDFVSQWI